MFDYQFFSLGLETIEQVKAEYKRLALKYHPDLGGSNEIMKKINAEYERYFKEVSTGDRKKDKYQTVNDLYREILDRIITLPLTIELVGSWLWVSGNTSYFQNTLREAGLTYSRSRKKWYWNPGTSKRKFRKSNKTFEEIKATYGSETIQTKENKGLNGKVA